jgi:acyl-CoA synthetase (NDP forming)
VLKAGRSSAGSRAVASHTAAIAGADEVYDALFAQAGAIRLRDFTELVVTAQLVNGQRIRDDGGLAVLTVSGGAGALVCDEAADVGLEIGVTPADVQRRLAAQLPFAAFGNPIDVTGQVANDPQRFRLVTDAVADLVEFGPVLIFAGPALMERRYGEPLVRAAVDLQAGSDKQVIVSGPWQPYAAELLHGARVPYVSDPLVATRMLGHLRRARRTLPAFGAPNDVARPELGALVEAQLDGEAVGGALSEARSKALLAAAGVPIPRSVVLEDGADPAAVVAALVAAPGSPIVLMASAPDLLHMSELGLVHTGLTDEAAVWKALGAVRTALAEDAVAGAEVLVEEQVAAGVELLVDVRVDAAFGVVVTVGQGGVYAEAERDVAIFVGAPAATEFLTGLRRLRVWPRLSGARGRPAADLVALHELVRTVAAVLAAAGGRIVEIELNPVIAGPVDRGCVAVDATVHLRSSTESQDQSGSALALPAM